MKTRNIVIFCFAIGLSATAAAKTWFLQRPVEGSPAQDVGDDYSMAAAEFRYEYAGTALTNQIQKGDLVDVQYQDGSVLEFTLDPTWKYTGATWDPTKIPKVKQGPKPAKSSSIILYQPNGNPITYTLFAIPTASTPVYTITVTQFGGGCDGCSSTTSGPTSGGGGGAATGGGGGSGNPGGDGGGTDPTPCSDCSTKDHQ